MGCDFAVDGRVEMSGILGKPVELKLPCTLTDRELQSRGLMLGASVIQKAEVEQQRREAAKEFRDRLTGIDELQRELTAVLTSGIEFRMVGCLVQFHTPAEATKRTVRCDTGEVVKEEPMTAGECQLHLWAAQQDFEKFMREQERPSGAVKNVDLDPPTA